jgi:hypothetical protein
MRFWNPKVFNVQATLCYKFPVCISNDGRSTKKEQKCHNELLINGIIFDESIVMHTNHPVKKDKRGKKIQHMNLSQENT